MLSPEHTFINDATGLQNVLWWGTGTAPPPPKVVPWLKAYLGSLLEQQWAGCMPWLAARRLSKVPSYSSLYCARVLC